MRYLDRHIGNEPDDCELIVITKHEYGRLIDLRNKYAKLILDINKEELKQEQTVKDYKPTK